MVERTAAVLRTLSAAELVGELDRLRPRDRPSVLCFDGDGTLWSGDVGEDLFGAALRREALREPARLPLRDEAVKFGLPTSANAVEQARVLFDAYLRGSYPERDVCAMMTWCYAGFTRDELGTFARAALAEAGLSTRLNDELSPILGWAREAGVRTVVISASPRVAVEEAASLCGFSAADVMASTPRSAGEVVLPELLHHVPYAEEKVTMGRKLAGAAHWLGSFGDNVFDVEMLLAASIGVAVKPKLSLRSKLPELPGVVLLG